VTIQSENNKSLLIDLLIIATIWIVSIVVVNPLGEFPLNDDWAPAQTVKQLVETGSYHPSAWMAMSLVTNILWGALFCVPAGFSFIALRLSTLTISLIGMVGVYWIGKDLKLPRPLRIFTALVLGFNPIYYALSNTFMTDVPFTALVILSTLFLLRCLKDNSNWSLSAGIAIAVAATLSRQLGIAIPLAFAIAYIFRFGFGYRHILRGLAPLIISAVALYLFQHWLAARGELSAVYLQKTAALISALKSSRLLARELLNLYVALLYLGLFLSPALVLTLPALWREHTRGNANIWLAMVIAGGMTLAFTAVATQPLLPMLGNILDSAGIGPPTLRDTYILGSTLPALPNQFWLLMTWIGMAGSALIIATLTVFAKQLIAGLRFGKTNFETISAVFLLLCAASYLFPIFTSQVFDRYLVPVIPLLMLGILSFFTGTEAPYGRLCLYSGCALLLAVAFFSIGTTRDYLTWNRVRWQALTELTQVEQVAGKDIDGGFEFNGWKFYDPAYARVPDKSWWWVHGDTYLITFHSALGYNTVKEYPYSHWLPPYAGNILVLKKNGSDITNP